MARPSGPRHRSTDRSGALPTHLVSGHPPAAVEKRFSWANRSRWRRTRWGPHSVYHSAMTCSSGTVPPCRRRPQLRSQFATEILLYASSTKPLTYELLDCYLLSMLKYAFESCTLSKTRSKRTDTFELWYCIDMCRKLDEETKQLMKMS